VFALSHHPTAINVSDGIQDAFKYLQTSWRKWLPAVGVIAACSFVMYVLAGSIDTGTLYHTDPSGHVVWNSDALSKVSGPVVVAIANWILSLVGGWVFYATAICGLRNRPLAVSGVIVRGLVTVASSLIVVAAVILLFMAVSAVVVVVAVVSSGLGVLLMLLLILAAIPLGIYVGIRLIFSGLAIFDGFGPIAGLRESWRLSQGSVLRMLGWGLMAFVLSIGIAVVAGVITAPFGKSGLAPAAQAASAAITVIGAGLVAFMMAVLYESERARKDPTLYPVPAWPGYGSYPTEPLVPGPYPARPYAPGPYTAGPYAGGPAPAWPAAPYAGGPYPANPNAMPGWVAPGPYPTDPTAIPGWVGPNGPAPAWPAAPYAGGPYPANPNAMPGWVAPGPAPAWANNPANPASLDPAAPGPEPAPMGNSDETDPTQQPPNAPQPPEPPAS